MQEIVPKFKGNDATVEFNKLKIMNKDWSMSKATDIQGESWIAQKADTRRSRVFDERVDTETEEMLGTTQDSDDEKWIDRHVEVTMHEFKLFEQIQICSKMNLELFKGSLSPKYNQEKILKAGTGAGRSGSFFFNSHDDRFVIKTMS